MLLRILIENVYLYNILSISLPAYQLLTSKPQRNLYFLARIIGARQRFGGRARNIALTVETRVSNGMLQFL